MSVLLGCSPQEEPPGKWLGRNINEFFMTFGPPKSSELMQSGQKSYLWENRSSWRAITGQIPMLCSANIIADSNGVITEFAPRHRHLSKCPEKFGKR
jgi:hypothetical protein